MKARHLSPALLMALSPAPRRLPLPPFLLFPCGPPPDTQTHTHNAVLRLCSREGGGRKGGAGPKEKRHHHFAFTCSVLMIRGWHEVVCLCLYPRRTRAYAAKLSRRQRGKGGRGLPTPAWYVCGLCCCGVVNQSDREENEKENNRKHKHATMTASAWKEASKTHLQARRDSTPCLLCVYTACLSDSIVPLISRAALCPSNSKPSPHSPPPPSPHTTTQAG